MAPPKKSANASTKRTTGVVKGKNAGGVGGGVVGAAGRKVPRRTTSQLAQLILPVPRVMKIIRDGRHAKTVSKLYAVKITAILEFATAELLTVAMEKARSRGKKRVTPRDFMLAIKDDEDFSLLLRNVQIAEAGVEPRIHDVLLPRRKKQSNVQTGVKGPKSKTKYPKSVPSRQEYSEEMDEGGSGYDEEGDEESGGDVPEAPIAKGRDVSQDY